MIDWRKELKTKEIEILATLKKYDFGMDVVFVPFSQSRNKNEKYKSLNWRIALTRAGQDIITTDYSAGTGHIPAKHGKMFPKYYGRLTLDESEAIEKICENGKKVYIPNYGVSSLGNWHGILKPEIQDVYHSILMDIEVLDYYGFEDWVNNMGYDSDSLKGFRIYQACLDIALEFTNKVDEKIIAELREVFQDY